MTTASSEAARWATSKPFSFHLGLQISRRLCGPACVVVSWFRVVAAASAGFSHVCLICSFWSLFWCHQWALPWHKLIPPGNVFETLPIPAMSFPYSSAAPGASRTRTIIVAGRSTRLTPRQSGQSGPLNDFLLGRLACRSWSWYCWCWFCKYWWR